MNYELVNSNLSILCMVIFSSPFWYSNFDYFLVSKPDPNAPKPEGTPSKVANGENFSVSFKGGAVTFILAKYDTDQVIEAHPIYLNYLFIS